MTLSHPHRGTGRREWLGQVFEKLGSGALIVVDDLPKLEAGNRLTERLVELVDLSNQYDARILSTTVWSPSEPVLGQVKPGYLSVMEVPQIDDDEAAEILRAHGAPEKTLDALEFRFMRPDGTTSEWSAEPFEMSFATAETYRLRASARDSKKAVSCWSAPLEVAVMEQYSPFIAVPANRQSYQPGQMLSATVYLENRGAARVVDAYLGALLPDGTELYYPDFRSASTTFELVLPTATRLGPLVFYEAEVTAGFAMGEYVLFAVLLDAATGESVYESRAGFRVRNY